MSARSVSVIVEDALGRILLLLRGPTDPWMPLRWNLPGGGIERGEAPTDAARRETREEAGLRVYALSQVMQIGDALIFHADDWDGRVRLGDREHTKSAWVPKEIAWTWDLVPAHRAVLRRIAAR